MFAGGLGMTELLVILFIVLIIFGAGKLPEIGAGLGKGMRNFRKAVTGDLNDSENESKGKELPNKETFPEQK